LPGNGQATKATTRGMVTDPLKRMHGT